MTTMTSMTTQPSPSRRPTKSKELAFRVQEMKRKEAKEFNASWGSVNGNKMSGGGAGSVF